jgi:ABC-type nitrate/sulfonate/bicarbonate transport system substrate-binding protein
MADLQLSRGIARQDLGARCTQHTWSIEGRLFGGVLALALMVLPTGVLSQEKTPLTIATQTTWAPSGQIFDVLCRTNILELNGFEAKCRGFTYGPPLGEALIAGLIDNAFGADVPALRMSARKAGSKILHRTNDWVFGILVRANFEGKDLLSLKGKKLSGPFGTGTFPRCVLKLVDAGITDPFKDMTLFNQDVSDQPQALSTGQVDAVTTWHPMYQRLIDSGTARVMWASEQGDGLAIQGLSGEWLSKHGENGAVRFLKAWIMATWWASNNLEQAHEWFAETSRIPVKYVRAAADGDRYLREPHKDIKTMTFEILPAEIQSMQSVVDYLHGRGLLQEKMNVASMVDNSYVLKAQKEINEGKHRPLSEIKPGKKLYAE